MGLFTEKFGAVATREPDGDIKSRGQTDLPVCKFCGGEIISVRSDFDASTRTSIFRVSCKNCGKDQK